MKKFLFRFEDSATMRKLSLLAVFTFMFMGLGFSQNTAATPGTSPSSVESILRNHDLESDKSLILPILKAEYASLETLAQGNETGEISLKMSLVSDAAILIAQDVEVYTALTRAYVQLATRSENFKGTFDLETMFAELVDLLD